jgi:hypothetical protein
MNMPLGSVIAQPSTAAATAWQLSIPCTNDPKASLTLSLVHYSEHAHWLCKELDARRREEVKGHVWSAPFRRIINRVVKNDDDDDDLWDWLCGASFDYPNTLYQDYPPASYNLLLVRCLPLEF